MVTTKRNSTAYGETTNGINLIKERNVSSFEEFMGVNKPATENNETLSEAKERMQKNLERLLNYDRYTAENMSAVVDDVVEATETTETAVETTAPVKDFLDEDIKPTSTTLQFGDINANGIVKDISRQQTEGRERESVRLSSKGRLVVVLYSLALTVILALIVINTGILARLGADRNSTITALNDTVTQYNAVVEERIAFSSNENVINEAYEYGIIE